jgi:hypothetical protein
MDTIQNYTLHCLMTVLHHNREWHSSLQRRFFLHPVVHDLLTTRARPIDWHRVVLEWPHVAESDPTRLAYTRDERSGEQDRQVVTSINKYVRERWTHDDLPDHVLRELVDSYNAKQSNTCEFVPDTTKDYIKVVQTGPQSCMRWDSYDEDDEDDRTKEHPYRCYDPQYGWRMAVRRNGRSQFVGRALVLETDKHKCFVRTFKADGDDPNNSGYSHSDEKLCAWLKDQGYEHLNSWPNGTKLYTEETRHGDYLAPYVDGDRYHADLNLTADGARYWSISGDGEYELRETNGLAGENERCTCEHCGARVAEDEVHNTGVDGDYSVCNSCLDSDFTWVDNACRWGGAYINNDEVVTTVEGDSIVPNTRCAEDYMTLDYGCHEGEWTHIDRTVCDIDGNYWHEDDVGDELLQLDSDSKHAHEYVDADDVRTTMCGGHFHDDDVGETIVHLEHGLHDGEYVLLDETVTDSHGERWHTDDIDKYIKQSALDEDVYVDIDQIEITEGETE